MLVGEATTFNESNDRCPKCKKIMGWTEGLLQDGTRDQTVGRYACIPCGVLVHMKESRAVRKGKKMAETLPLDISCMDKRITSQSLGVQLGILRAQMHCATCKNDWGDPCTYKEKCDCLYCRIRRKKD